MHVDHKRLIRADTNSPHVTHHVAENGQVHDGHPRLCANTKCRQWGSDLMQDSTVTDKMLAPDSPVWTEPKRHPLYAWIGVFLTLLMVAIAAGIIVVTIRNL